jgi:hypothetical protein
MMKSAQEITKGDVVISEDGRELKVTRVEKGLLPRHLNLAFSNGEFSEVEKSCLVMTR